MAPNNASKDPPENPNEKLPVPKWITAEYFQEILEKDFPGLKSVLSFNAVAAASPGDNYASIIVRVHFELLLKDGGTEKTAYIVKTSLINSNQNIVLKALNPFPKERELYESLIPQFEKIYAEAGKMVQFAPKSKLFEKLEDRETIVMEDLKQKGFENIDRFFGFHLVHIEEALKKLAKFHAASAVHFERSGPYSKHYNYSFYVPESRQFMENIAEKKHQLFLSVMAKWGDCEKYIKLWPQPLDVMHWFDKTAVPDPNEINVLNHGDCWSNNIMFRYNKSGHIEDTFFIDFQMCRWGSPAQDLHYMITTSAAYNIRVKEFDRFIRIYQEHLAENLKLLKYSKPIPSLKDMHILMIKHSPWAFFTATTILPITSMDADQASTLENAINDTDFRRKSLMMPRYIKHMKQILPWWENRGTLQILS